MKNELSRRDFVKASGALVVCFSATSLMEPFATAQGPFDTHPSHIDPEKLDSWLAVAPDGRASSIQAVVRGADTGVVTDCMPLHGVIVNVADCVLP